MFLFWILCWISFSFTFLFLNFEWSKFVAVFGVDSGSSFHIDNKKNDILVLVKSQSQGLDNTTITAEAGYSINFSRSRIIFLKSSLYLKQQFFI